MVLWSLLVERVHRRASTGLDWDHPRPWRECVDGALLKIAGTWATWGGIAIVYVAGRFWWQGPYALAMQCLITALPLLLAVSIPYCWWLERHLVERRDGAWHLGAWLTGQPGWEGEAIRAHLLAWAVKGFFLPFMLAILPGGFGPVVRTDIAAALADPVRLTAALTGLMFTLDIVFATAGYLLTLRPLDAHIRSANPFAAGWTSALICYPPFVLMDGGGPLDYHPGTADWSRWFAGHVWLLWGWGALLVALTAVYAWATVAFGLRFSNLTNRGILTHGPYGWSRHPAYLAKNLFWLAATIPVLTTGSWLDGARATLLMGAVAGVYYWRARTEERHLMADTDYRAYHAWMGRNGAVPRLVGWVLGRPA
jgi:protein-S-isoprenylcysteine O-methyltransferase Ste14